MFTFTKEQILEALPSGSGFDLPATITRSKTTLTTYEIPYHCMDENGYYDGWIHINAAIDLNTLNITKVTFSADTYHRRKYINCQKDYFIDTIRYHLDKLNDTTN